MYETRLHRGLEERSAGGVLFTWISQALIYKYIVRRTTDADLHLFGCSRKWCPLCLNDLWLEISGLALIVVVDISTNLYRLVNEFSGGQCVNLE